MQRVRYKSIKEKYLKDYALDFSDEQSVWNVLREYEELEHNILDSIKRLVIGLTDIERVVAEFKLKEVSSPHIWLAGRKEEPDPEGLFSPLIFGPEGSLKRLYTFAYIDLSGVSKRIYPLLHPAVLDYFSGSRTLFSSLISATSKGVVYDPETKKLREALPGEHGMRGYKLLAFILENLDRIANVPEKFKQKLKQYGKNRVLIHKFLVIPPEYRPLPAYTIDDLNQAYIKLIRATREDVELEEALANAKWQSAQEALYRLYETLTNELGGKSGKIRSRILAKRVDFSGRSVVVGDMELKPYEIGVPYKMLAGIAEPFILHVLYHQVHPQEKKPFMELLQEAGIPLNKFEQLLVQYRRDFLDENDPRYARIVRLLKDAIDLAVRDKWVLAKRDPALHRGSFIPMKVVPVDGYALRFPNTAIAPLGMDFDGDSVDGSYEVTLYNEKGEVVYEGPIANLLQTDLFEPALSFGA